MRKHLKQLLQKLFPLKVKQRHKDILEVLRVSRHPLTAQVLAQSVDAWPIYADLKFLEKLGHVESFWGEATPERGWARKKYYRLAEKQMTDFKSSLKVIEPVILFAIQESGYQQSSCNLPGLKTLIRAHQQEMANNEGREVTWPQAVISFSRELKEHLSGLIQDAEVSLFAERFDSLPPE